MQMIDRNNRSTWPAIGQHVLITGPSNLLGRYFTTQVVRIEGHDPYHGPFAVTAEGRRDSNPSFSYERTALPRLDGRCVHGLLTETLNGCEWEAYTFKIGDTILPHTIFSFDDKQNEKWIHGKTEVTITNQVDNGVSARFYREMENDTWYTTDFWIISAGELPAKEVETESVFGLEVMKLQTYIATIKTQWAHDILLIGERLNQEYEDRSWCDEFVTIVKEVNEGLHGPYELPIPEKDYDVEVKVDFSGDYRYILSVPATSQEEADRMVSDDMDSFLSKEEARDSIDTLRVIVDDRSVI